MSTPVTARTRAGRTEVDRLRRARAVAGLVLALGTAAAGCSSPAAGPVDVAGEARAVALSSPAAPVAPAPTLAAPAAAGSVTVLDGPFTDRVAIDGARVEEDGHLRAALSITSDVSELLALELDVAWYDATGTLVASTRAVVDPASTEEYHGAEGVVGLPLEVAPPAAVPADAAATLAVPVLVNE